MRCWGRFPVRSEVQAQSRLAPIESAPTIGGLALTNPPEQPQDPAPKIAKPDGSGTGGGGSGGGGPDIRWGDRRSLAVLGGYATRRGAV